jgi:hypothetical protein
MDKSNKDRHWIYDYILIHVARTWERIRLEQPNQEMPQDNIESALEAIPCIALDILTNNVIQKFIIVCDTDKGEDFWLENTEEGMSDSYIENTARIIINKQYL